MKEDKITTTQLTSKITVINNPELIKVRTIKAKYVEQMPKFLDPQVYYRPEVLVLGRTSAWIIVMIPEINEIGKVHMVDYTEVIYTELIMNGKMVDGKLVACTDYNSARNMATEEYRLIPVLFED